MNTRKINYWDISRYTLFTAQLHRKNLFAVAKGAAQTVKVSSTGLFYSCDGKITVACPEKSTDLNLQDVLLAKPDEYTVNTDDIESVSVVFLDFELLALDGIACKSSTWFKADFNISPFVPASKQSSALLYLSKLYKELSSPGSGNDAIIQSLTELIMLQFLISTRQHADPMLMDVGGLAFYSRNDEYPMKSGRTVWFTDIKIWKKKVEDFGVYESPELLGILRSHGAQVLLPTDGSVSLETACEPYRGNTVSNFSASSESPYHVAIWPSERLHIDLRAYRNDYCITFYIKSNMTGSLSLTMVSLATYIDMLNVINIDKADEWIPVCIHNSSTEEPRITSPYISTAMIYIQQNCVRPITVSEIAEYCHISIPHLSRLFREQTGSSVYRHIIHHRIYAAQKLLTTTDLSIEQITHSVSFYDIQHMSRTFMRHIGMKPGEYRRIYKKS